MSEEIRRSMRVKAPPVRIASLTLLAVLFLPSAGSVAREVLGLGPIFLGMHIPSVKQVLGKPKSARELDRFVIRELTYSGLVVQFDEDDLIAGIESTSPRYCFDGWLCPRMDFQAARTAGQSHGATCRDGHIEVRGDGCWISASADEGKIGRVELICQP